MTGSTSVAPTGAAGTVLVLNCGSSSVKYRLLRPAAGEVLADGSVERLGDGPGRFTHRIAGDPPREFAVDREVPDHAAALDAVRTALAEHGPRLDGLLAVGHRVVHGGDRFSRPTVVDDEVLRVIDELAGLAPLHNPACATGIRAARRLLPDVPHVAVFDTAFHRDLPARAATYAVPAAWRERLAVRRYGFHGTSHAYVSRRVAQLLARPLQDVATIVLHLGNGASACAVDGGRSIDTSMGMTPLAGLVMGTRSGDVDPALPEYLRRVAGQDLAEVTSALNHGSGLLGLAGASDVREVTRRAERGDPAARLALDVYCYRVRCYVGAYYAALGRLDAIAFTAGVGENSAVVRAGSLAGLERLGIAVDDARNREGSGERVISPDGAPVTVVVVPTDEELEIARQTVDLVLAPRHDPR
ncbi:MAG TPA: acetate kinase [Kineosporiaceae bacterium]